MRGIVRQARLEIGIISEQLRLQRHGRSPKGGPTELSSPDANAKRESASTRATVQRFSVTGQGQGLAFSTLGYAVRCLATKAQEAEPGRSRKNRHGSYGS